MQCLVSPRVQSEVFLPSSRTPERFSPASSNAADVQAHASGRCTQRLTGAKGGGQEPRRV